MKILQVIHGFPPYSIGGTEICTYNLARELAERHEVHVFYPVYYRSKDCRRYDVNSFEKDKIRIHEIGINKWDKITYNINLRNIRNKKVEEKFEELLNEIKPDIVHFQHLIGLSIFLPFIAKKYTQVVLSLNDYWLVCPTTHFLRSDGKICNNPSPKDCSRCLNMGLSKAIIRRFNIPAPVDCSLSNILGSVCKIYRENKIESRTLYVRQIIEKADKVIAPSKSIVNKFKENNLIKDDEIKRGKVIILHHGVNVNELTKVIKRSYDKVRFGFVGVITERKGTHILVEAFKKLSTTDAELRIYGAFNPSKVIYHRHLAKKSKENPNIRFMGSFDDIKEPYSNIDVLVVPSITYEGYGLVVQEAFATKTPVISSDIGALNEFVKHMKNGLLFRVNDSNDLAEKMRLIVENPSMLDKLKKGISPVKSINQQARELEKIYEEILAVNQDKNVVIK